MYILGVARTLPMHSMGGMQAIAWDLFREFARQGHRVTVLTTSVPGRTAPFVEDDVEVVPIEATLPERCDRRWWTGSLLCAKRLPSPPDVVFSVSAAGSSLLALRRDEWDCPFVFQAHGTSWGELVSKWRSRRPLQWAKSVRNLYWLFKDAAIYREFDRIVAVGDIVATQLRSWPHSVLSPQIPVETIRNGVDTTLFAPSRAGRDAVRRQCGWGPDSMVAAFAARLHPQKGALQAIRSVAYLIGAGFPAKLLIIGEGEEGPSLRQEVVRLGLSPNVAFAGPVPRTEMPRLLAAADAFVFPTLRQEGLPMNVLEALACGLTPVCSTAMRGVLDEALQIRYANPSDVAEFSNQIQIALTEGASAQCLLTGSYSLAECVSTYSALFDRLRHR